MKIYINKSKSVNSNTMADLIKEDLTTNGHEVVNSKSVADLILTEISGENKLDNYVFPEKTVFYCAKDNGAIAFFKNEKSIRNDRLVFKKGKADRIAITNPFTVSEMEKIQKDMINYIVGRVDRIQIPDTLPLVCVLPLLNIKLISGKSVGRETALKPFVDKFNLTETDIEVICEEVNAVISFGNSKIFDITRNVKQYFATINGIGTIISNCSDSILQNLFSAERSKYYFSVAKDEEKKDKHKDNYNKYINTVVKTVNNSLFSKNTWEKYSKDTQKQMGVYSLYIPDNSLADGEILIPRPENAGAKIQRLKVGNCDVIVMPTRKTLLISGNGAITIKNNLLNNKKFRRFNSHIVSQEEIDKFTIKEYPQIGDIVVATRHPITTLLLKLKVVGYTDDCSIRMNSKTMLALYGDADGDAATISWSKWTDNINLGTALDIDEFCKAAGINLDNSKFHNKFDINHFLSLTPDSDEECLKESTKTGLEQANAKKMTREVTGIFGAAERTLVQSAISNDVKVDFDFIFRKSWLSQILVQAKNILAKLQDGQELDDLTKSTLLAFVDLSENTLTAAKSIAVLLNISDEEALDMISDWKGLSNNIEELVEEEVFEDEIELVDF